MQSFTTATFAAMALATLGLAAPAKRYAGPGDPFYLSVRGEPYNGQTLSVCPAGTGASALCVDSSKAAQVFGFSVDAPIDGPSPLYYNGTQTQQFEWIYDGSTGYGFFEDHADQGTEFVAYESGQMAYTYNSTLNVADFFICPESVDGYEAYALSYATPGSSPNGDSGCKPVTLYRAFAYPPSA